MRCGWYRSAELSRSAPATLRRLGDPKKVQAPRTLAATQARQFPGRIGHSVASGNGLWKQPGWTLGSDSVAILRGGRREATRTQNPALQRSLEPARANRESRSRDSQFRKRHFANGESRDRDSGFAVRKLQPAEVALASAEGMTFASGSPIAPWILCARLIGALQLGPLSDTARKALGDMRLGRHCGQGF